VYLVSMPEAKEEEEREKDYCFLACHLIVFHHCFQDLIERKTYRWYDCQPQESDIGLLSGQQIHLYCCVDKRPATGP
jgi:hypothetical protein